MKKHLLIFAGFCVILLVSCSNRDNKKTEFNSKDSTTNLSQSRADSIKEITTLSGLVYMTLKQGNGSVAKEGHEVLIHETMRYLNDSLLFDSRNLSNPVKVLIGGHQAIEGVDEGLRGMQVGEIRKLIIPPALSKRSGVQTFPHPDSTLIYEIELVEILNTKN